MCKWIFLYTCKVHGKRQAKETRHTINNNTIKLLCISFNYRILCALLCSSTENYYVRHSFMYASAVTRIKIMRLNYYFYRILCCIVCVSVCLVLDDMSNMSKQWKKKTWNKMTIKVKIIENVLLQTF